MKNHVKLLILLVVVAVFSGSMNAAASGFSDTKGQYCDEAVTVLSGLRLLQGKSAGAFEPDAPLTRAEMATIIVNMMGMLDKVSGEDIFEDVQPDHWAYDNITAAYRLGLVKGIGGGKFLPEGALKYAEAIKILVLALGYEVQAETLGGYPLGYIAKASQLGIMKGAQGEAEREISRGTIAVMVYNALETPICAKKTYGSNTLEYAELNETPLNRWLKIDKIEGQVTGNHFTCINALSKGLLKGEVAIDTLIAKAGGTNAEELLGKKVKAYVKYFDGDSKPVILVIIEQSRVRSITISADDILPKTTKGVLYYEKNGKEASVGIDGTAAFILNGRVSTDWYASDLMPKEGSVTLIINDGASADVVLIEAYTNYRVNSKDTTNQRVILKSGDGVVSTLVLDSQGREQRISITDVSGEEIDISDLNAGDIVSIARSVDNEAIKVIRSANTVSGTVRESSTDELVIGDSVYKLADSFKNAVSKKPAVGETAVFALDFSGKIAFVNTGEIKSDKYGWLVRGEISKGIDGHPRLMIFTEEGEMKTFDITENIILNYTDAKKESILSPGSVLMSGETVKSQLLRYKTNESGEIITEIRTATDYRGDLSNPARLYEFSLDLYINSDQKISDGTAVMDNNIIYYIGGTIRTFASRYRPRENTKIFVIPGNEDKYEEYEIKNYSTLSHGADGEIYTNLYFYDIDEDNVVGAMVWNQAEAGQESLGKYPSHTVTAAVIKDISKGMNKNGDITTNLTLYNWNGKEEMVSADVDYECLYKLVCTDMTLDSDAPKVFNNKRRDATIPVGKLGVGDIIQYTADSDGNATLINVLFRVKTPGNVELIHLNSDFYITSLYLNYKGGLMVANGTVKTVSKNGVIMDVNQSNSYGGKSGNMFERSYPASGQIMLFDKTRGILKPITTDDIAEGDNAVCIWSSNVQKFLIVYR